MNHYATQMMKDLAGRHYWFAKKLQEQYEMDVTVFCASTFLKDSGQIDTNGKVYLQVSAGEVPFVVVKTPLGTGNGVRRVINMASFAWNLFPACRQYAKTNGKPDLIIASSVHPLTMIAGILIAKKLGIPCICEIRDLWPEAIFAFGKSKEQSLVGKMLIAGEHWIYRNADQLIFTKEGDTDYLKEKGWTTAQGGDIDLHKCHYINNGIDLQSHEERISTEVLEDADLQDETKFNVVYAGIIRPTNQIDTIVDCAKILSDDPNYKDVRFLVYGDGSELNRLKKRVEDEKIPNVTFKGFVERRFIPYVLSKSSVNLLNYTQNGYNWSRGNSSNKLFEYMASGKPVISTVKMGYSIIDKYECGVELEACTPAALADGVRMFHDMEQSTYERYCRNAQAGARDFDFGVLTEKLVQVIEKVETEWERRQ